MTLPNLTVTVSDGGLGQSNADATGSRAIIGYCASGTVNTVYSYTNPDQLIAAHVAGPAVEKACLDLSVAGGTVYLVPINASTPGAAGSVTATRVGTSTATMAVSGAPFDAYSVVVTIVKGNAAISSGEVTFTYSLDGGTTTSAEWSLPANGVFAVPKSGLTLTFSTTSSSLDAGDKFTFACTAPAYSTSDVTAACAALKTANLTIEWCHLVGQASNASGAATVASTLATQATAFEAVKQFLFFATDMPDVADNLLQAAFGSFQSKRVMCCAGFVDSVSVIDGRVYKRPAGWAITAHGARLAIGEHWGKVRVGSVQGVSKLYRDEALNPGLDDARFATLRTINGVPGYFVTRGRLMSAPGSDFSQAQYRRVIDAACRTAVPVLMQYLNDDYPVDDDSKIEEGYAKALEEDAGVALSNTLVNTGNASRVSVHVDRDFNAVTTPKIPVKIRVVPLGYAEVITADIGFENPAFAGL